MSCLTASAAPCSGSKAGVAQGGRVVHPTVIHERVVTGRQIVQVAMVETPKDIVDTAVGAGTFKTLVAALGVADLVGTLKGPVRSPCSPRRMRRLPNCHPARSTPPTW